MRRIRLIATWLAVLGIAPGMPFAHGADLAALTNRAVVLTGPAVKVMAVHDELGLLVTGESSGAGGKLVVHALDKPDVPVHEVALSVPAGLAEVAIAPLALAWHPRLPLLYAWTDAVDTKLGRDAREALQAGLPHLTVYGVAQSGAMTVAGVYASGTVFTVMQSTASLGVSPGGERIFIPNAETGTRDSRGPAIGYLDLGDDGLPLPVPVAVPGSLDGRGLNQYAMRVEPTFVNVRGLVPDPPGRGLVSVSRDLLLFAGTSGPGLWDVANRRGALGLAQIYGMSYPCAISAHPTEPLIYGAGLNSTGLFCMEHADGYPTLRPDVHTDSYVRFTSAPVVMSGDPALLVTADRTTLFALPLDEHGRWSDDALRLPVASTAIRALAYSTARDRLYVMVD